jgi:two-component system alkaline phosphatase synthesis response regulator PhoP
MPKILVIDDEQDIRDIVSYNLKKEGFEVEVAEDGERGIEKSRTFRPDVILLDVMMPRMDGIEVCETIRSIPELQNTLICFLTARSEDYSQIAGLEAGADDYISKPLKPKVLISRLNALLRRKTSIDEAGDSKIGLFIDRERYLVTKDGKELHLPKKEFELLALLHSKPGKVFDRDEILERVWGSEIVVGDRTIDVHVRRLRSKLGRYEDIVRTERGSGYRFDRHADVAIVYGAGPSPDMI